MRISLYIPRSGLNPAIGFGYAAQNIVKSLHQLGHEVRWSNAKSKIQLNFTQPHLFKFHKNQYQIGYTPWESTGMRKDWTDRFNECDEVWATSTWNSEVFKNNGVNKDIKVYPHGIEDIWTAYKRKVGDVFRFLHIGEPAPRKGGSNVLEAFVKLFGNNPQYRLTIKAHNAHTLRTYDKFGDVIFPDQQYSNVTIISDEYDATNLVNLYHMHHCLVYPSWGEGFGFIPLQGLATGMPVISTYDWAEYENYLGPLKLKSKLTSETLPKSIGDPHAGQMFKPDQIHLEEQMLDVTENFRAYSGYYFAQSTEIHEEYNWIKLTKNAFKHLEEKI